jgi:hypothetical protein
MGRRTNRINIGEALTMAALRPRFLPRERGAE